MGSTITRFWLMTVTLAVALAMSGCGGGGEDIPMPGEPMQDDYIPLDGWNVITSDSLGAVGVEHDGYDLRVWYDDNFRPHISSSAPEHQPMIAGTWTGEWAGYVSGELHEGGARIDVTLDSKDTNAELVYDSIPEFGSMSSGMMSVTDGAFEGSRTVSGAGTFDIRGQFGGPEQAGVAGYVDGPGFHTVFHGER